VKSFVVNSIRGADDSVKCWCKKNFFI